MNLFSDILLPANLAVISCAMGMSLRFADFKKVLVWPKATLIGLGSQMIALPLLGFLIAWLAPVDPVFKVGIVLIAACPGGTSSNFVTYLIKGRLALSITLTAFNSFLISLTVPLILELGLASFMGEQTEIHLPFITTLGNIFFIVLIPTFIGMLIRKLNRKLAAKAETPLRYILPVLMAVVFAGVIFNDNNGTGSGIWNYTFLLPYLLALNLAAMLAGFQLAKASGLNGRSQYTIAIEVGLQNSALAIFVAKSLLDNQQMALTGVIYGGFSFFSTFILAYLLKRSVKKKE